MVMLDGVDAGLNNLGKDTLDNKLIAKHIGDLIAPLQRNRTATVVCMGTRNLLMDYFPSFCINTRIVCDSVNSPQLEVQEFFGFAQNEVRGLVKRTLSDSLSLGQG
jgi:hypothetical protein